MSNDQISNFLFGILIFMVSILVILVIVLVVIKLKDASQKNKKESDKREIKDQNHDESKTTSTNYTKQSIFNFMEFDKVEDNMIVQKNGNRYLMVIECQGINYDLMSGVEKASVEQGFLQFLNTLNSPIQIYVQTRTVNLEGSLVTYKDRLNKIRQDLVNKQMQYNTAARSGEYTEKQLESLKYEVDRQRNLFEYGADVIQNTERMNLNRNILRKNYYIIISYVAEDLANTDFDKEEIKNLAFSELYTRCQAMIGSLSVCGINSKILDSNGLAELLYVAYNRDDSDIYDLEKLIRAGYNELYSVSTDVLDKRMKALDEEIERKAIEKANDAVIEVREETEKERAIKEKEKHLDSLIDRMAKIILDENRSLIGDDVTDKTKKKIDEQAKEREEEKTHEKKQKTTRTRKTTTNATK